MAHRKLIKNAAVIIGLAAVSLLLQFSTPNIADPDAFYHMAHAQIYREHGLFYSDFPWAQFSVIKDLKADIWYGFHLFLVPFTYITNPGLQIKLAGALTTFLTLISFYWVLTKLKIQWPWVWVLLFILVSPDVMYRLTMTRPHNLSLALALIIFALTLTSNKNWPLFFLAVISSWLHSALSWVPIFITILIGLVFKIRRESFDWKKIIYLTFGAFIGICLHPNPISTTRLTYIQVVKIILIKMQNIPLIFGRELKPPTFDTFLRNILPIIIILITSMITYKIISKKIYDADSKQHRKIIFSSFLISSIFFFITTFVARRSYDILIGFSLITASSVITMYLEHLEPNRKTKNIILSIIILIIGLAALNSIPLFKKYNDNAWPVTDLKESSLWLKENSQPGEIVFNTSWDQFGNLIFWNRQNYYINGMDPIFEYTYNPQIYWKNHFILADVGYTNTCGMIRCKQEEIEDIHTALINDFKASWVVIKKSRNPKTYFYWLKNKTFPLVFENNTEAVFKIPPL